jgi:hypothetical protein
MSDQKEERTGEYWIAFGMIEPEWVYMNHFLEIEEVPIEFGRAKKSPTQQTIKISLRSRED